MLNKIIPYSFYLLFFLTPLFWNSSNYELFEFNKMILTYALTIIIAGTWILKTINDKRLTLKRTPLDIPLLLFLGANILSTVFSIDPHTSIWGYYSRSNGGLLSIISYLLLYWAFVSNMNFGNVKTILKFGLAAGFIISIWATLEHFGVSFSCVLLRGEFNDSCWVQDVQARVFATLGQPNWLAGYLAMLIFPALYFFLTAKTKFESITYYLLAISYYLAFTFTYSRGPTLGLIGGMIVFIILYFIQNNSENSENRKIRKSENQIIWNSDFLKTRFYPLFRVILSFLVINLLFGSALTSFRLVSKFAAPARPAIALPQPAGGSVTQLENGGTESGQIRFIVWQGAWEIFKHYPLFGSGLETFAYSYYQYRPVEHNLTSEWDFLYNKAHNEYLNYLATTGVVGISAYSIIIITFIIFILKKRRSENLLLYSLFASYISYLIYNFFLFSVVIIAIFFYLFPALIFVATDSLKVYRLQWTGFSFIYKREIYIQIARFIVVLMTVYLLYSVTKLWVADTLFNQGQKASDSGNPGKAYNLLSTAVELNPSEPFYRSELGFNAAQAASALKDSDATLSAQLKDEAIFQTDFVLSKNPKNVSFWRSAVRTYFELAILDKKYLDKTISALDTTISLAPSDPKLFYNKALILDIQNKRQDEVKTLEQAIKLKPNYQEALDQLKEATGSAKKE